MRSLFAAQSAAPRLRALVGCDGLARRASNRRGFLGQRDLAHRGACGGEARSSVLDPRAWFGLRCVPERRAAESDTRAVSIVRRAGSLLMTAAVMSSTSSMVRAISPMVSRLSAANLMPER